MSSAASCSGKDGLTWAAAERSARGLRRRTGSTVMPYHCRHCGQNHIGNAMGGNVSRRIKRDRLEKIEQRERAASLASGTAGFERRELWATS